MGVKLTADKGVLTIGGNYNTVGIEEVHIGDSAPTKDNYVLWINPEGDLPDDVATKQYVDEKIKDIDISGIDLTGYATESFVAEAIATIELTPGPQGEPGKDGVNGVDGAPGEKGEDGYTPVKGVDYYTEEEKQALIDEILELIPEGGGGESLPASEEVEF